MPHGAGALRSSADLKLGWLGWGWGLLSQRSSDRGWGCGGDKESQDLTLQLASSNQQRPSSGLHRSEATAMPLTSVVWLMGTFSSWEINLQASKDPQDRQEGCRGWGWGAAVGTTAAPGSSGLLLWGAGGGPSIHTRWHRASVWLHQGLRRSRQISNAWAALSKHSHTRCGQASVSRRLRVSRTPRAVLVLPTPRPRASDLAPPCLTSSSMNSDGSSTLRAGVGGVTPRQSTAPGA